VYLGEVLDLVDVVGCETLGHLGEALGHLEVLCLLCMLFILHLRIVSEWVR
jgi:hypothetical protein